MAKVKEEKTEKKKLRTFTKKWVNILMFMAVVDIQLSFVLAFLGKEQIAETLSVAIVTEIIGVMIGYFAKAFLETYAEKKNELQQNMEDYTNQNLEEDEIQDEDYDV